MDHDLDGRRILVVEDDYAVALELCDGLKRHGATVLGPAPTPYYAGLLMMGRGIDGAVLDIKLYGGNVFDFARQLKRRRVPFVFTSGAPRESAPSEFSDVPWLQKPVFEDALLKVITTELNGFSTRSDPAAPAPRNSQTGATQRTARPVSHERWLRAIARGLAGLDEPRPPSPPGSP